MEIDCRLPESDSFPNRVQPLLTWKAVFGVIGIFTWMVLGLYILSGHQVTTSTDIWEEYAVPASAVKTNPHLWEPDALPDSNRFLLGEEDVSSDESPQFVKRSRADYIRWGEDNPYLFDYDEYCPPYLVSRLRPPVQPVNGRNVSRPYRLWFSVNSGRSGSGYLAHLLNISSSVHSTHEDKPNMGRVVLHRIKHQGLVLSFYDRHHKAESIEARLANFAPGTVYADTSHLFFKSFFDVVMCHFRNTSTFDISVLFLRRDFVKTVMSQYRIGFRSFSFDWYYRAYNSYLSLVSGLDELVMDELDAVIAYLIDVEEHMRIFRLRFPGIRVVEVSLEDLNDVKNVTQLLEAVSGRPLTPMEASEVKEMVGVRVNTKREFEAKSENFQYYHTRVSDFVARAVSANVMLPPIPSFHKFVPAAEERKKDSMASRRRATA